MRSLSLAAALLLGGTLSAADAVHSFESVIPRGNIKRVVIDVPAGSFTVRTGNEQRLSVAGVASRDYDSEKEGRWAQKVVDDISIEYYVNGSEALLRPKFGPNADSWRGRRFNGIELRIDIPRGIDVRFKTSAGEIDMIGDFGDVDIDLTAGEIELKVPKASVKELRASARIGEVRTHLGDEVVTREGILPGRTSYFNPLGTSHLNLHVTTGEIDVTLVP